MDIFKELPFELQSNIFMIYLKKKKEKINKNIIELLKDRSPFYLNSLFQLNATAITSSYYVAIIYYY